VKEKMKANIRKKKILECSKREFSKNGFYKTQISDIANSANVSRATIYQYFKNKEEIYMILLEKYLFKWQEIMSYNDIDVKHLSAVEYFSYQIRKTLKFFASDRYLSNIVLRVGLGVQKDLGRPVKQFEEGVLSVITGALEKGQKAGNIKNDLEVEFTANLISGAILRTASYYFGPYKRKKPLNIKKAADEIAVMFALGIFTDNAIEDDKLIA